MSTVTRSPIAAYFNVLVKEKRVNRIHPARSGIALLPTFVGTGVTGLQRILPDKVSVQRDVWVSVRTEQSHLSRIKSVTQFLKYIFARDGNFLSGKTDKLAAS